jgi:hypothetical protein
MKAKGDFLAVILNDYKDCYVFLHNTREEEVAVKILNEGFIFENQLPHSTDRVNPGEPIEITYFLFQRKDYGTHTIIIAIPKVIYEFYLEYSLVFEIGIEEVLSISKPYVSDNDEMVYTISPKHIPGYFNTKTGDLIRNKNYDPSYNTWLSIPDKEQIYSGKKTEGE